MKHAETKLHDNRNVVAIIVWFILLIWSAILVSVVVWGFVSSFKSRPEFFGFGKYSETSPIALPDVWLFDNYIKAFDYISITIGVRKVAFLEMTLNSLVYAIGTTAFSTLSPMLVAYACSKYDFKLGKVIYIVVLTVLVIPIVGNTASTIQVSRTLGFYDNFIGLFFMRAGFTNMYFLIFYEAFKAQSKTFMEAAKIDGASDFAVFFKISVPLVSSVIVGVAILLFIADWNEYSIPMIYLPSHPVIILGLFRMQANATTNMTVPILIAGAFIACIPTMILFILFRSKIMGNISMGGVKE